MRAAAGIHEPVRRSLHDQQRDVEFRQPGVDAIHGIEHLGAQACADRRAEHERIVVVRVDNRRVATDAVERQTQNAGVRRHPRQRAPDREGESRRPREDTAAGAERTRPSSGTAWRTARSRAMRPPMLCPSRTTRSDGQRARTCAMTVVRSST